MCCSVKTFATLFTLIGLSPSVHSSMLSQVISFFKSLLTLLALKGHLGSASGVVPMVRLPFGIKRNLQVHCSHGSHQLKFDSQLVGQKDSRILKKIPKTFSRKKGPRTRTSCSQINNLNILLKHSGGLLWSHWLYLRILCGWLNITHLY